jgi:exosortase A-associated hydrolase 2
MNASAAGMLFSHTFFLQAQGGQRLCVHHQPAPSQVTRGAVVFVHAFGDEMNKSRRMTRLQAQALARAGFSVLLIDLKGCGDSSGDFVEASWSDWIDDVLMACHWLQARVQAPLWLWGHRAGCLLATEVAARLGGAQRLVFWQAPASGQLLLQQFLRMKATSLMLEGNAKAVMAQLREQLARDEPVEVGGYQVSAALANGLGAATMAPPPDAGRLVWLESSTQAEPQLSPVATKSVQAWQAAGWQVQAQAVQGPAFWQTTEIEDAPALIEATHSALITMSTDGQPQDAAQEAA